MQASAAVGPGAYRAADAGQHLARVQAGIHLHNGNAGSGITGFNGSLYWRCAAPAGKQ